MQGGLGTVGALVDDALAGYPILRSISGMGIKSVLTIQQRLAALAASALTDGSVDWDVFERLCGLNPETLPEDGLILSAYDRARPVEVLHIGSRAPRLRDAGLETIGDLLDDRDNHFRTVFQVDGLGQGAVKMLSQRLASLESFVDAAGVANWAGFDEIWAGISSGPIETAALPPLDEAVQARPVEVLRLGTKARYLHDAGLHTLGDLAVEGVIDRLLGIPGIGPKTARLIPERITAIRNIVTETGGKPDWDKIAASWGFTLTPEKPVVDSDGFLAALPEVIATVVGAYESAMDRLILSERISRPRAERVTLEAIGIEFDITRERVRQRQVRLLDSLSDALINDDQSHMPIQFRESFQEFWVRAARHFEHIAELAYHEFERKLEEVWSLPAGKLAPFMPLAIAILADGVRMPVPGPDLHPALDATPQEILERPLYAFPVRRAREGLEGAGIFSFGLLLNAARQNRLPLGRDGRIAIAILNGVGRALAEGPAGGADAWAAGLELTALPRIDPADGAAFIASLDGALAEAAKVNGTSGRAEQIYRLRTCIPRRRRPTLDDVAAELETHGPSVKREETILLASLHAQLVEGDMTDAAVVWRDGFTGFFKVATEHHRLAGGDYNHFCNSLGRRWGVDADEVRERVEGLWAVLSLYPGGRRARPTRNRTDASVRSGETPRPPLAQLGSVVVLRGFRRAH
ncbi:MAG: helix-hairpin-helix domain-containing protein [Beijerinckiaceae bacterium]|nr:helix-hairpin-helix domain-containing protein [Beijerinckiaceae bacterium]